MGAIFGIWYLDDRQINENHPTIMKDRVMNYGRDAQKIYIDQHIALGSCLNKISVFSQREIPVYEDVDKKRILVADAQIYNREELIHHFKLTDNPHISNNELIMAAYHKWGVDCPKYINGDFAFVIWEKEKKQLTLVRDHLGVRPLFYYSNDSTFVFSTDYRAILALPFIPKKLNESMLYKLLTNQNSLETESTFFEGIQKVPQAHILTVSNKGAVKSKYWSPGTGKKITYGTEEEYFKALHDVVLKAIKMRMEYANLKIGAQMSGGLDSSVINILANRELIKQNKKLSMFSWSPSFQAFERQSRDERNFIEEICNREGLTCSYYDISQNVNNNDLDKETAIEMGAYSPFNQELEKMSSEGVRLILSGWGGDQGISHRANLFELFVNGYFLYFFKEAFALSKGSYLRFMKIIYSNIVLPLFKPYSYFGHSDKHSRNIAKKEFTRKMKKYSKKKILYFNIDPVKHLESGNIQTRTELSAWLGAEYNMQYLFPYLDYQVVDLAMSIPRHMFYKNGINRYVYRKAFEGILPKELCYYVPKDDIARLTYLFDNQKDHQVDKELLEKKLNKDLFSNVIDFDHAEKLRVWIDKDGTNRDKTRFKRLLNICYNIQKIVVNAEKSSPI